MKKDTCVFFSMLYFRFSSFNLNHIGSLSNVFHPNYFFLHLNYSILAADNRATFSYEYFLSSIRSTFNISRQISLSRFFSSRYFLQNVNAKPTCGCKFALHGFWSPMDVNRKICRLTTGVAAF